MSLKTYFNKIVDILADRAELAGESTENTDKGTNREILVKHFLLNHVPKRFSVALGGDIFGLKQKKSGQIDIIIANDISISFLENAKSQYPIESVAAAISVKSNLTSDELENALRNLASIPQPSDRVVSIKPGHSFDVYKENYPPLFVFAYSGITLETCMNTLREFYKTKPTTELNRVPRAIIVLNKYIIFFPHHMHNKMEQHPQFDPSLFQVKVTTDDERGLSLFFLMIEISEGLGLLQITNLDFIDYLCEAYDIKAPLRIPQPLRISTPQLPRPKPRPRRY